MADYGSRGDGTYDTSWRRDQPGLGVWEHRGKVALSGWGMSPVDRRWDGVSMDRTLGAFAKLAITRALDDAGLKPEDVDGLFACPHNMAGAGSGPSADWGPYRPYFDPPYDSEDGLTSVSAQWLLNNFPELKNVDFAPDHVPMIGEGMGWAAQAVAEGRCKVAVFVYCVNNLEGRYRQGGSYVSAAGPNQWSVPWGASIIDTQLYGMHPAQQYLGKYGGTWEELIGPMVVNEHRNGMMNDWGFYATNTPSYLTYQDYLEARPITWPARIWDFDRPVNAAGAFVITRADHARDLKSKPVYIFNHNGGGNMTGPKRSSQITLQEWQTNLRAVADMVYEGAGLQPKDIDIFNPYDGFSAFMPFSLEAFRWHGVGEGDAVEFVKGDISAEGPHPLHTGGGNLGNGRTGTSSYIDGMQQLRGTAGQRQVKGANTALVGYAMALSPNYLVLSNEPD